MELKKLQQLPVTTDTRVVVRLDVNAPVEKGALKDISRLEASLPTLQWMLERGARVIVLAHLGRPEGKKVAALSLKPVAHALGTLSKFPVQFVPERIGSPACSRVLASQQPATVIVLENIRFYPGEEKNDPEFARQLAALGDVYVNDGFSVCHRTAASVVGVARLLPAAAGLLIEREMHALTQALQPKKPAVLIVGGMKIETKLPVIQHLLPKFDCVLLAGGVANTLIAAQGYGIGGTNVDKAFFKEARALLKNPKIYTPVDVVVGKEDGSHLRHIPLEHRKHELAPKGMSIMDIGPATIALYKEFIATAQTIVWNGPMGYFEQRQYRLGTDALASAIGHASKEGAFTVVGGGETTEALQRHHMVHYISHVSTGGGAMLEYLSGKELPGLRVLSL